MPIWLCILSIALFTSIAHELEHDLIHYQYFKKQPVIHNTMMFLVWVLRPNTINPWYRRKIHFHHHKTSGTKQDIEERLVGNGEPHVAMRFLVIFDGLLGLIFRKRKLAIEVKKFSFFTIFNAGFPLTTAYFACLYLGVAFYCIKFLSPATIEQLQQLWSPVFIHKTSTVFEFLMVVFIAPNFIRSACLNIVTSSMHYYGGVNNLIQQTQILSHWLFSPIQWFCFNFGNTHSIHHFVPNQPFYIRQLVASKVKDTMIKHGVRENDLGSILSGNRYVE